MINMNGTKWLTAALGAAIVADIAGMGMITAHAAGGHAPTPPARVEFFKVTQNYPTNGIDRFILKGNGCLKTEDLTKLRLVDYNPSHHKIIYRCIQP